ncbi:unnamed protein product [Pleuronectes platessa]|uniref:Uncharacterized protein n=1 Tax=Pleuronectes platessa TaxID=8262 RepID=A0A9N7ZBF4_PLEPL|nr:unnamed protein product [Pleuronectes platessa]
MSWTCNRIVIFLIYIGTFVTFPITGWFVLKTVSNYQRMVVFRLGRACPPKGPGIVLVLHLIDQWQKVDLCFLCFQHPALPELPMQVTDTIQRARFSTATRVLYEEQVSDLQALSVHTSYLQLGPGLSKVCLRPKRAFSGGVSLQVSHSRAVGVPPASILLRGGEGT